MNLPAGPVDLIGSRGQRERKQKSYDERRFCKFLFCVQPGCVQRLNRQARQAGPAPPEGAQDGVFVAITGSSLESGHWNRKPPAPPRHTGGFSPGMAWPFGLRAKKKAAPRDLSAYQEPPGLLPPPIPPVLYLVCLRIAPTDQAAMPSPPPADRQPRARHQQQRQTGRFGHLHLQGVHVVLWQQA